MGSIKMQHLDLATKVGAGLLCLIFFLPWLTFDLGWGISFSISGWRLLIGFEGEFGYIAVLLLLLIPLGILVCSVLKKDTVIILGLAAAGLIGKIILHIVLSGYLSDDWLGVSIWDFISFFYVVNFLLYIALVALSFYVFRAPKPQGGSLPGSFGGNASAPSAASSKFCTNCGTSNEGPVKFCNNCGHDLTS